jgi:hypothetical protein
MSIGFHVDYSYFEVGSSDFLHSFFSTISHHLEPDGWGSKYPLLMNDLYQGSLSWENAEAVIIDVLSIRESLMVISPNQVVWDIEDLALRPPWGDNISSEITSLGNYFVTSDGNDMFEVLVSALSEAMHQQADLFIE